jgi:hypothetical protein
VVLALGYIVKTLVEIEINSILDKGTTFSVYLEFDTAKKQLSQSS